MLNVDYGFHEYANLFPLLDGDGFNELVADLKANGLIEPITLHEQKILDGRNRYRACVESGVEPQYRQYAGTDPLGFVISANLHRRHLSETQKSDIGLKLLPILEERANKRKLSTLKQNAPDAANRQERHPGKHLAQKCAKVPANSPEAPAERAFCQYLDFSANRLARHMPQMT